MAKKDQNATTSVPKTVKNKIKIKSRKARTIVPVHGKVFVKATFNNTLITVTNLQGGVIAWSNTGKVGFTGTRKSTPFAATKASEDLASRILAMGMKEVDIVVSGPGMGRDAAIRAIKNAGLKIQSIADITPIPHNGCRPKGRRKV